MLNFKSWLEEAKKSKKNTSEPRHQTTATSSPLRGQNQDQSGYNGKNDVADYTISDGFVPGIGAVRGKQVQMMPTVSSDGKNAPSSGGKLQAAADRRRLQLDKLGQQQQKHQQSERMRQQKQREKSSQARQVQD